MKQTEEKELEKVLVDYKGKYQEFDRAMKKSRETFKKYELEIKNLDKIIAKHEATKRELNKKKNKKKKD